MQELKWYRRRAIVWLAADKGIDGSNLFNSMPQGVLKQVASYL
jgi:hypothetical protein